MKAGEDFDGVAGPGASETTCARVHVQYVREWRQPLKRGTTEQVENARQYPSKEEWCDLMRQKRKMRDDRCRIGVGYVDG
jgi:hypothetical protein